MFGFKMFSRRSGQCFAPMWLALALFMLAFFPARAWPQAAPEMGGRLEAEMGDESLHFPILRSDYLVEVEGDLVTVSLSQTFANPADRPLNATYLFPLPTDAAVYKMEMEVGDERISAVMQRVEEARATYERARDEGRAAALLTERRPNMFTQQIANLMPGLPVKVTLSYVQAAARVDGSYELVIPLVVGPRYQPAGRGEESKPADAPDGETLTAEAPPAQGPETGSAQSRLVGKPPIAADESRQAAPDSSKKYGVWELESLPAYPPVSGLTIPRIIDEDRVSLTVNIRAGQPVTQAGSPSHALAEKKISEREISLSLAEGRTVDNRDFILNWSLAGEKTGAGLLAHKDERGGFFSLLIEPPAAPAAQELVPREMVFVLDTSGSMRGQPLTASQKFMRRGLQSLRAGDYFRIVTFDNAAREFSDGAVPATKENINQALTYVKLLQAGGGTEAAAGLRQALGTPQKPGTLRLVVLLTDGYIGNEVQVLELINQLIGQARILAFGVGTSVNRYLLEEAARQGRGWCRVLDPTAEVDEVVAALAGRLEFPVLTDITVEWDGEMMETAPDPIPDLFAGQSLRIMGRYEQGGSREVVVSGLAGGHRARMPLKINLPEKSVPGSSQGIPLIWAREHIAGLHRQFQAPEMLRKSQLDNDSLKECITLMGLSYNLVTPWTSFVAVSNRVVNDAGRASEAQVPLPQVAGVEASAYGLAGGQTVASWSGPAFKGGGVPEPGALSGLALMAAAGWAALRRRRQGRC